MLPTLEALQDGRNVQINSQEVHPALGEINVMLRDNKLQIKATVLMSPSSAEGWQTGMAIDCSASMKRSFGGKNTYFTRSLTPEETESYSKQNLIEIFEEDGQQMCRMFDGAYEQMLKDGILHVVDEENEVQDVCRKVIPMLAGKLDADGGTTVIYWALGPDGGDIKVVGDLTEKSSATADYTGVAEDQWGNGTRLMPAIRYFLSTFEDASMGFYVFVTDGRLDDFEEVKQFTIQLSHDIHEKKVKPVKLILIGVGNDIDETQLEDLDDLPDTHDLPVDVWDHKIASEMRSLLDIFTEVVDDNRIIAPSAEIQDDSGNTIKRYTDGLTALMLFSLPTSARGFKLILPNGATIEQKIIA